MGLFDFLSNKPTPRKIAKAQKVILNEHHQQQVRQESLEQLAAWGTDEALAALVKRLGTNFRDSIKNETEKKWVHDILLHTFGPRSIGPLENFIRSDQTISAAIRTLDKLMPEEELIGLLVTTLTGYSPEDHRTIDARLQLVEALVDHDDDERIVPATIPYLLDHDDDVRMKAMDLLQEKVDPKHTLHAEVVDQFVAVMKDPEASGRITRRAADGLIELGAKLEGRDLDDYIPDGYQLQGPTLSRH